MRKLLKTQGFAPTAVVTDKLPSYGDALSDLGMEGKHITGGRSNKPAERTTHATLQVSRFSPEISFNTRRHLQYLQRSASPDLP
jgi:transposase-like protein